MSRVLNSLWCFWMCKSNNIGWQGILFEMEYYLKMYLGIKIVLLYREIFTFQTIIYTRWIKHTHSDELLNSYSTMFLLSRRMSKSIVICVVQELAIIFIRILSAHIST